MTQEEKAKAYDEAIKVIKDNLDALNEITETGVNIVNIQSIRNCFYKAFPELKESEDEMIRKALIHEFEGWNKRFPADTFAGFTPKEILAWLEKQGEQKVSVADFKAKDWYMSKVDGKIHNIYHSVDKVEPKFKVGDWITNGFVGGQITSIEDNYPCYKIADFMGGINTSIPFTLQDNYHLWSIKDAKDGDVLAFDDETIVIFKDLYNATTFHSYCYIEDGLFYVSEDDIPDWWKGKRFQPSTKKQRELLFQKMKEAGYEWNVDDKKLIGSCSLDEDMIKSICEGLYDVVDEFGWSDFGNTPIHDIIDWLKKIKQRIG